ncbi:hypothetical protein [Vibrio phage VP4B]|uniref:Uncharacterized protein n=1 Tax=Vibrio phage VP4B TaxID=1262540 RepID=V9M0E0_9CAUD|nr:hypothetical protein FDJ61_gp197 [Vibrio phage VP4B]AGB07311.1 hypothetical protein [Vibrio phage VP4B]
MSAVLEEIQSAGKVSRGETVLLRGKFKGLAQPTLVKVRFNGESVDADVYTDQQGYFVTEFPANVTKVGMYPITVELKESTEAGTVVTGETEVRITR